jgi:poly(3-hydroxybutyrate) depolymerase
MFRIIVAITFVLSSVTAKTTRAMGNDQLWDETKSNKAVPTSRVLSQYASLCLGDADTMRSFRSLFLDRTIQYSKPTFGAISIRYFLFAPNPTKSTQKWPLIVYLHGQGDGESDEHHHLTCMARCFFPSPWQPERYPFFLLSVLCPRQHTAWTPSLEDPLDMLDVVASIVEDSIREFPIDSNRISLMGVSKGGTGCWELALRYPNRFSAMGVAASRGCELSRTHTLAKLPIWAFHSTRDPATPINAVRQTVQALKNAGGTVHLTEIDSESHDSWTPAFDSYDLLEWLISQQCGKDSSYAPGMPPLTKRAIRVTTSAVTKYKWGGWLSLVLPALATLTVAVRLLQRWLL